MKIQKQKKNEKAITLVALVVTIILLLILAGVTIAGLTGENGLIAKVNISKKTHIKAEMKENLELAITELQTEKEGKATLDDITQEWIEKAIKDYECTIIEDISIEVKKVKMKKNNIIGIFIIDNNLNVKEIEYESSIEVSYDIQEIKENKLKILIYVQDEEYGLSSIEMPDEDTILVENNKKERKSIDYEIEFDKEYIVKIKSESGEEKEVKILETKVSKPTIIADTAWTNQNVIIEVEYGTNKSAKKEISIDGGLTYSTYTGPIQLEKNTLVKARITGKSLCEESELYINNIDKLSPNDFTPAISDTVSSTELKINVNVSDKEATQEYGCSGIKEYQYFVYKEGQFVDKSDKIIDSSWKASGLAIGEKYNIYVEAYDNAGNVTKSEIINYTKLEVHVWERYSTNTKRTYTKKSKSYSNITFYRDYYFLFDFSSFDSSTGKWTGTHEYGSNPNNGCCRGWYAVKGKYINPECGRVNSMQDETYNVNTLYYVENYTRSGSKITCSGTKWFATENIAYSKGNILYDTVISDSSDTYPDDGYQNGYWYVKLN